MLGLLDLNSIYRGGQVSALLLTSAREKKTRSPKYPGPMASPAIPHARPQDPPNLPYTAPISPLHGPYPPIRAPTATTPISKFGTPDYLWTRIRHHLWTRIRHSHPC